MAMGQEHRVLVWPGICISNLKSLGALEVALNAMDRKRHRMDDIPPFYLEPDILPCYDVCILILPCPGIAFLYLDTCKMSLLV